MIVEGPPRRTIRKFDYINCGPMPRSIGNVQLYDYDVLYLANMFCLQNILPKYLNLDGYAQFTGSSRRKIFKQDYVFIYLLKLCFKRVVIFRTKVFMCIGFKGVPQSILNIKGYVDIDTDITPLRKFVRKNIQKIDIVWKTYIANNDFKSFFNFVHTSFLENKKLLNLYIDLIDNNETLFAIRQVKKNPNRINQYLRAGINDEEGKYLFDLVIKNESKKLVEIGMANGISAAYMAAALKQQKAGILVSIDPFQTSQWKSNGLDLIATMKAKTHHKLIQEKSYEALPKLLKRNQDKIDLVFIDGWHTFDYTLVDIFYSVLLLRIGGILVIDDALHPGVANTLQYLDRNYIMLKRLVSPSSFGAYEKIKEDTRDWNFHRKF
jgi:predicted O-methyltransferase YrrM